MEAFLDELASGAPTPGGGSAGCVTGAMAAALAAMACAIAERKGNAGAAAVRQRAEDLRQRLRRAADEDAAAFDGVLQAMRRPKDDPDRKAAIAIALKASAEAPLGVVAVLGELADVLREVDGVCPAVCRADFEAGVLLAQAALKIERKNVEVNLDGAQDAAALRTRLEAAYGQVDSALRHLAEQGG